jgi:hypothetical protein
MSLKYNINKGTIRYLHFVEIEVNHIMSRVNGMISLKRYQTKSLLLGKTCEYSSPKNENALES